MAQPSPTVEGFRAAWRRPGITLAEISWRWSFGAAVLALLTLSVFEFLDTLPVSRADRFFLHTGQPFLVSHAIGHILRGSTPRVIASALILCGCLAVLWIVAASFGRAATVNSLLAYFTRETQGCDGDDCFRVTTRQRWRIRPLLGLNFLRVALLLAAILALIASGVIAGFANSDAKPHPGLVFLIFVALTLLIALLWSSLDWFLSVAPIFVLHEDGGFFGSMVAAMDFCRERAAPVFWSSTAFGVLHVVVFVAATSVVVFPLAFAGLVPGWVVAGAITALTLIYFAVVDWLYTGRMAAYVCILQMPPEPELAATSLPLVPIAQASIMRPSESAGWFKTEDDILSDVPGLVPSEKPPDHSL